MSIFSLKPVLSKLVKTFLRKFARKFNICYYKLAVLVLNMLKEEIFQRFQKVAKLMIAKDLISRKF